jgi:hypothetical protein
MAYERISYAMSDEESDGLTQDVDAFDQKVSGFAPKLPSEERPRLYKLGNRALPFVDQTLIYAQKYPQFASGSFDLQEFINDLNLSKKARELVRYLEAVIEKLTDTYMAAGADAFAHAREYYHASKAAARAGKPGADAVATDLKNLLYKRSKTVKTENKEESETGEQSSAAAAK